MTTSTFKAWSAVDVLRDSIIEFDTASSIVEAGRKMELRGESIRAGAMEEAEADLRHAKAKLKVAIVATRHILDEMERGI